MPCSHSPSPHRGQRNPSKPWRFQSLRAPRKGNSERQPSLREFARLVVVNGARGLAPDLHRGWITFCVGFGAVFSRAVADRAYVWAAVLRSEIAISSPWFVEL